MMQSQYDKRPFAVATVFLVLLSLPCGPTETAFADQPASQPPTVAAAPRARPETPIDRLRSTWHGALARVNQIEGVQMVTAVVTGSQMGPGDGWFHPGKSRYGWQWLAKRFDQDGDELITAEEFKGDAELFERLDRDRNGELTADDFDWSDASPFLRQQGQAGQWFARIDKSSNGRITSDEWQQFFERLAGEKGYVSREDLRTGLFPPAPKRIVPANPADEGPSVSTLLLGIASGELGSLRQGPDIDQSAPDFELETQDHKQTIRLSSFRDRKPVVLIFGSFT